MQQLIESIRKYVSLTDTDISVIKQLFIRKEIKAGDYFLKTGKICKEFAFIEKGLFRHFTYNAEKEETFYFSAENNFVCDYGSFINGIPSNKGIVAMEDTIIWVLSYERMQTFYTDVSSGERFGRLFLEDVFTNAIRHIISMHTDTAGQRYLNFLKLYKHIQQRIPQYYIASFVGVTPQSLSRIRRQLVNK